MLCRKTFPRKVRGTADPSATLRFGRDDKGEGDGSIKSRCWTEAFFITLGGPQAHDYSVEKHLPKGRKSGQKRSVSGFYETDRFAVTDRRPLEPA